MMENDPFTSIDIECCSIADSAEDILPTSGFANERVGPEDDDSEELTQPEVPPIMMFSLSDTQSQGAADSESSSDAFTTAAETVPPISNENEQSVPCNASTGADLDKAIDLGDSSVPMDHEVEDSVSESESDTENYRFVKRGADSDNLKQSELRCGSSEPIVVQGPGKVPDVQDSAIEDDQRPSKMKKFDILDVLKEIAEHQKSCSSIPKRYAGLTFTRPRWWPENYEDMV